MISWRTVSQPQLVSRFIRLIDPFPVCPIPATARTRGGRFAEMIRTAAKSITGLARAPG
jgi:hypothetical protein